MKKEDKQLLIDLDKSHIMTPSLRNFIERFKQLATRPPVEIDLNEVIPYQLCPKCNGQGTTSKPPYISGDVHEWIATGGQFECNLCNGKMVIPMHTLTDLQKIPQNEKGQRE